MDARPARAKDGNAAYEARRCGNCGKANRKPGFVNCEKCMREAEEKTKAKDRIPQDCLDLGTLAL